MNRECRHVGAFELVPETKRPKVYDLHLLIDIAGSACFVESQPKIELDFFAVVAVVDVEEVLLFEIAVAADLPE